MAQIILLDDGPLPLEHFAWRPPDEVWQCAVGGDFDEWFADRLWPYLECAENNISLLLINLHIRAPVTSSRRSDDMGIRLLAHIRLSSDLPERVRTAPALIYGFRPLWALRIRPYHLLLHSPSVRYLQLPDAQHRLLSASDADAALLEAEWNEFEFRTILRSCHAASRNARWQHDFRNLVGASRLAKEIAGDVLDITHPINTGASGLLRRDLPLKTTRALDPVPPTTTWSNPPRECWAGKQFLLIDDEHDKGWAAALHAGITGTVLSPEALESSFEPSEGYASDEVLTVLQSREEAEGFIREHAEMASKAVNPWATRISLRKKERKLLDRLRELKIQLSNARGAAAAELQREIGSVVQEVRQNQKAAYRPIQMEEVVDEIIACFPYLVVLIDIRLEPERDGPLPPHKLSGIQIIKYLKHQFPTCSIVGVTGSDKAAVATEARRSGATLFWSKALSPGATLISAFQMAVRLEPFTRRYAQLRALRNAPRLSFAQYRTQQGEFVLDDVARIEPLAADILQLLEDAFWQAFSLEQGNDQQNGLRATDGWAPIGRTLGFVQELRLGHQENDPFPSGLELEFRRFRNDLMHRGGRYDPDRPDIVATRKLVLAYFDHVLRELWPNGSF